MKDKIVKILKAIVASAKVRVALKALGIAVAGVVAGELGLGEAVVNLISGL